MFIKISTVILEATKMPLYEQTKAAACEGTFFSVFVKPLLTSLPFLTKYSIKEIENI